MYAGSKYESHYTVWTAWISISIRVRVRVDFILQNLAPLALPYMCPQPDEVHSYPLPQPGTVRVSWTVAPNSTHGLTLAGYSVLYREEGGDKYQSQQVTDIPSPGELETFELAIEGLELGTTYKLRVAVVTLSGVGKYSEVINVTTYAGTSFSLTHVSKPSGSRSRFIVRSAHLSSSGMPVLIKCTAQAAVSCCCSQ